MAVKNLKMTLTLKLNRKELIGVTEELKNVKYEKGKETTEDPQVNSGDKFICTICDPTFSTKKGVKEV
jgi:hypothetical protein